MACNYDNSFRRKFSNELNKIRKNGISGVAMLPLIFDFLKSVQKDAEQAGFDSVEEWVDSWVDYINNHLERNGITKQSPLMLRDIIINPETKISDVKQNSNTTETLDVSVTTKKEFRRDFLERIYDGADFARNQAVKQARFNFCSAMLFDRNKGRMTKTEEDLNNNIREYQQELFDTIFNYLKAYYNKQNGKNKIEGVDYSIYSSGSLKMYEGNKYTGVFEKIFNTASTVFNTFNGRRINLEYKQKTDALKAFNAFQTLLHFDEFLLDTFGDDIKIANMNIRFTDTNKYKLAATATNMAWNNQADDDIDLTKSINGVSKLIVESTRLYDWKGNIIPDSYILFGQFINVICKIKDLAWDLKLTRSIKLNATDVKGNRTYDISSLSKESQDYIESLGRNATLATLINRQGFDPVDATTAIFELLTSKNPRLEEALKNVLNKFKNTEKYVLMSLGKELFNNNGNSLRVIQDAIGYRGKNNYLNYLLQTVDGTWSVKNCQIRTDMESGFTEIVGLSSSSIKNTQRIIEDNLNNLNHYTISSLDINYKAVYDSKRGFSIFMNLTESPNLDEVRIDNLGRLLLNGSDFKLNGEQLLPFLDAVLHLNFRENPKHLENYITISGHSKLVAIPELFKFAVEIVRGQYVSRKINEAWVNRGTNTDSKEDFYLKEASKYFSAKKKNIKIKFDYGTIDIIPDNMLSVLENLAEATILTNSSSATTILTDSEGKALSTSTPSRHISAFQRQFEVIRNNTKSPANSFMIVNDVDTLVDIQTVREYKSATGESKTFNLFNTREFLESSILHDFLTPLISDINDFSKYGLLNNHTIAITPSVNSDKNTISKMIININTALKKMGYKSVLEFLKDNDSSKLMDLINTELQAYYNKLFTKIEKDLLALSRSSKLRTILGPKFVLHYTPESFANFKKKLDLYNSNPINEKITARALITEASKETGVKINEPLHIIYGKNDTIMVNNSLLALYYRYNNEEELNKRNMPSSKDFWKYKASELTSSLIKNKTVFDTVNNKKLYKFLTENGFEDWISSSGTLIIAKVKSAIISSEADVDAMEQKLREAGNWGKWINEGKITEKDRLIDNLWLLKDLLVINPLLEKYNMLDYLYSQEFILSTVGTHINHPYKKGKDIYTSMEEYLADEAGRFQAQHKRNVSYTASMHPFLLNQFDGIPLEYNISVLLDINDYVYTVAGKTESVKPFDGATFVNPFIVLLENNSLNGEHAGIHKKQFVHFYDEELGTGGIIKTAGFGLTNSWMRNSPFMERMMKNMTNVAWKLPIDKSFIVKLRVLIDGLETIIDLPFMDITKKIQGEAYKNDPNNQVYIRDFYFSELIDGELAYFKVKETISNGDGTYTQKIVRVNSKGTELYAVPDKITGFINSNYGVWKYIFHGLNSVGFNEKGELSHKGKYGESSIKNTVEIINQCGYLNEGYKTPKDLKSYYQPGKYSDTHYVVTEGAIKQGTANFNTKDCYYKDGKFNSFKIKMTQAGIQLDKEHHADDSEISMMTQVVSACAALGHTWNEANKMYKALYQLTLQGIEPIAKPLAELFKLRTPQAQFNFSKVVTGILIKLLANGSQSKDGLIYSVAYDLIEKYRSGQLISDADYIRNPIPVSDPMMFLKIQSLLSSMLTSASIKLKFKGILSVLVPSHETIKLYGGKMRGDFKNFDKEIAELQAMLPELSISEIEMGRTYIIKDFEGNIVDRVHVQSPVVGNDVYGDPNLKYVGYYDLRRQYDNTYTFIEDITLGRNLGAYYCTFLDEEGNKYNFYDLSSSVLMYLNQGNLIMLDFQRKNLQTQLLALSEGRPVTVLVNGISKLVTPINVNIKPYEVVMPKTMAKLLGLTSEDSLDSLLNDRGVFTKKLVNNLRHQITEDNFTVALKRVNGNHIYVLTKEDFDKNQDKRLVEKTSYPPVVDPVSGEVFSVNDEGNKLYKMASTKDKIYLIDGKEVVVTDNLDFYLENLSYNTLYVANHVKPVTFKKLLDSQINHSGLRNWKNNIIHDNEGEFDIRNARLRNNMIGNISYNGQSFISDGIVIEGRMLQNIEQLGQELYTSFKKTLDIIAARIPAQSMQSFMPMKVVGYEEFDINTAYVSTHQIFLQGSDYDIDAVSLLTFELGNDGKFVGWSPYFNITSEEMLQASTELNYPTGNTVEYKHPSKVFDMTRDNYLNQLRDYLTTLFGAFNIVQNKGNIFLRLIDPDSPIYHKMLINSINYVSENGLLSTDVTESKILNDVSAMLRELFGWNVDNNEIIQLFHSLANIIDKHNLYANHSENVEAFTKNYVVEQMYRIAKNPSNLIQALTSVDLTTGEPKDLADTYSVAGKALKSATPGNVGNKFLSIEDNHVGKAVIGISAVGLKSFFALTQYANTVLKQGNPETVDRLLSKPIIFNSQTYYTIANTNTKGITNADILAKLNTLNGKDAALMISALLSLATDNAKELCLAKLNANAKMAGMYIYGLTMGIPFELLGLLLMSDVGNVVASLLKGSIITDELRLSSVDSVIDYLENPSSKIISIYKNKKIWDLKTGLLSSISVWGELNKALRAQNGVGLNNWDLLKDNALINSWGGKYKEGKSLLLSFILFTEEIKAPAFEVVKSLNAMKQALEHRHISRIPQNKYLILQALDSLIDGYSAKAKLENVETTLWLGAFNDFKTLHNGASELKTLGTFLGANQGVKNTYVDYLNFVKNFENSIKDRYETYLKYGGTSIKDFDTSLNFTLFIQDSEYRKSKIEAYEKIKASFNILEVLTTVPHYWGYLLTVHAKHGALYERSARYRTTHRYMGDLKGSLNMDQKIKALDTLVESKTITNYFNQTGRFFYLPKGGTIITLNSIEKSSRTEANTTTKIFLGTLGGNATYKNWVEQQVIPDLIAGYTSNIKGIRNASIANNEFIKSLRPNTFTKNPHKNSSVSQTTNINMSPRNEEDGLELLRLIQEFDSLTSSYTVIDDAGVKHSIPIKEIFYQYNLIAYNGKSGLSTLTRIFDNYANLGGKELRQTTLDFDDSGEYYHLSDAEIIVGTSLIESPFSSYNPYIYVRNKKEITVDLARRSPKNEEFDDQNEVRMGSYVIEGSIRDLDTNLILHRPTHTDIQQFNETVAGQKWQAIYDPVTEKFTKLQSEDGTSLKNLEQVLSLLVRYDPNIGKHILDIENLTSLIEYQINCL